jgi:hypothetical protein
VSQIEIGPIIGYLTEKSYDRLRSGGNGSRGTVPLHFMPSNAAHIPLYASIAVRADREGR